jgi:DUF4097 and DUF4098 domain-containing protein YvlB
MFARRASTVAAAMLAAGAAALALAGCYVDVGALQHRTVSYSVPATAQALAVRGHVGNVDVAAGGSGSVSVIVRLSFRGKVPQTTHRENGGTLTLDSSCPATETCTVSYQIRVPRAMAVNVTVNAGGIHLAGLAGQVTAHTDAGTISLSSLSGPIDVSDHAGTINGARLSSPRATLSSNVGTIDVTFSAAPAALAASTTVGSITLRVPGGLAYAVDAHTSVGTTRVSVPQARTSPHAITARARTGSITIEPG